MFFYLSLILSVHATEWKRVVFREPEHDQRQLVLVMDIADDPKILPVTVFRTHLAPGETLPLLKASLAHHDALTITNNPLWPIDHQWTDQDEKDYGDWINRIADPYFLRGGGIDVDCSKYAILLRWIYAHDHHLPAANTLSATNRLFGSWQSTTAWDALPTDSDWKNDQRFRAAVRYFTQTAYTHTIFNDMYPVAINRDYVAPGTVYLTLRFNTGHTRTIYNVGAGPRSYSNGISIIWGNEPASELGFVSSLDPYQVPADQGGFMRWRWPEKTGATWALRDAKTMRGYSTEQYDWDEGNYMANLSNGLQLWNSPEERYKMVAEGVLAQINMRLKITSRGELMCALIPCAPSDPIFSEYSTPNRDLTLIASIKSFQAIAGQADPNSYLVRYVRTEASEATFTGAPFSNFDILEGHIAEKFIADPTKDFFTRWGVTAPSAQDQLLNAVQILLANWDWRESQVWEAVSLCFPNNEASPTCDPKSPAVKKLATDRLDQALRLAKTKFMTAYNALDSGKQWAIDSELRSKAAQDVFCSRYNCTFYDVLFGDFFAKMTSNADSPREKRLGL